MHHYYFLHTFILLAKKQKTTKNNNITAVSKTAIRTVKLNNPKKTGVLGGGIRREQNLCWLVNNNKRDGPGRIVQELLGMESSTTGGKGAPQKDDTWLWEGLLCRSGR